MESKCYKCDSMLGEKTKEKYVFCNNTQTNESCSKA